MSYSNVVEVKDLNEIRKKNARQKKEKEEIERRGCNK